MTERGKWLLRYWPIIAVLVGMYLLQSGWAAILIYHAGIVLASIRSPVDWRTIQWRFRPLMMIVFWLAGSFAAPLVVLLLPILTGLPASSVGEAMQGGLEANGLVSGTFWWFVLYLCLPHPFVEEFGWREILKVDSPRLHLRDFEFASYHLLVMHYFFPFAWLLFTVSFFGLAVMSWIWRLLRIHFGGLLIPVALHAGSDAGIMAGVWWLMNKS